MIPFSNTYSKPWESDSLNIAFTITKYETEHHKIIRWCGTHSEMEYIHIMYIYISFHSVFHTNW